MAFWVVMNKGEIRISYFEDKGSYKQTAVRLRFDYAVQSLSRAQERDHPYGSESEFHHNPPVRKVTNTQQWHEIRLRGTIPIKRAR